MQKDKHQTQVIFRTFKDGGDVIAIFPELPGDMNPATCLSYQHIGQHGACSQAGTENTRPSTCEEVAPLKAELEGLGYRLEVVMKNTYKHFLKRCAAIAASAKQA